VCITIADAHLVPLFHFMVIVGRRVARLFGGKPKILINDIMAGKKMWRPTMMISARNQKRYWRETKDIWRERELAQRARRRRRCADHEKIRSEHRPTSK
jgi:hypothetical protein